MPKDIIIQQSLFLSHIHALYTVCITDEILPEIFWPIMIIVICFIVNLFLNIQFSWGFKTDPTSRIWVIIMSKDLVKTCLLDTWSIYIQNNAFEIVSLRYESYVNTRKKSTYQICSMMYWLCLTVDRICKNQLNHTTLSCKKIGN